MIDSFSIWLGVIVGGFMALLLAAWAQRREEQERTEFGEMIGIWLGVVGGVVVLVALLLW